MTEEILLKTPECDKFDLLKKEEVVTLFKEEEKVRQKIQKENAELRSLLNMQEQKSLFLSEQYVSLKKKLFGQSSEKSPKKKKGRNVNSNKGGKRVQLPSKRYPNLAIIEEEEVLDEMPNCPCCSSQMQDSGMWETSESITVIPKRYVINRLKRKKYRCGSCHGAVVTAPAPPRITPGGSYSDELILDVALSKFSDLIPIERYAQMASRIDLIELPPQSLIGLTHHLANFVKEASDLCKAEVKDSETVKADETRHKMLENKEGKKSWYLWGFASETACYFDIENTRSGDVAHDFLVDSRCRYLMTDVFSGYKKATRQINEKRKELNLPELIKLYCNAHARRKFKDCEQKETEFFNKKYRQIYRLEKLLPKLHLDKRARARKMMMPIFEQMKQRCEEQVHLYSSKSNFTKASNYFYNNFKELTLFCTNPNLPIDNNSMESLLRDPVVGRKTWYGTHSRRGAETTAVMFTLVESCKLNKVNPRHYFRDLVKALHQQQAPFTPYQYKQQLSNTHTDALESE